MEKILSINNPPSKSPRDPALVRFINGRYQNFETLKTKAFYTFKTVKDQLGWIKRRYKLLFLTELLRIFPNLDKSPTLEKKKDALRRIISFSKIEIPFYQERFSSIELRSENSIEDQLVNIPLLTKADIRSGFPDRFLSPSINYRYKLRGRTSGSTGESTPYIRPDGGDTRTLINFIFPYTERLLNQPVFVLTTPHCSGSNCSINETQESLRVPFLSRHSLTSHLGNLIPLASHKNILEAPSKYFESLHTTLMQYSGAVLVGDPVYLAALAWYLLESAKEIPKLNFILTSYELLTPSAKLVLQTVFECPVHSQYGGSELMGVARTCSFGFYHEENHTVWVEIIREGRRAGSGELGKLVLTDLKNKNMPFIRFEIGDVAEPLEGPCPCGSSRKRLGIIHGRTRDLFFSSHPDRKLLSPLTIDKIFEGIFGIKFYQLVEKRPSQFEIAYIPSSQFKNNDLDIIRERAHDILGPSCDILFKQVTTIRPEISMKFRFAFSEVCEVKL